jgi:gluconate 2-dehydrogenase gamma chain
LRWYKYRLGQEDFMTLFDRRGLLARAGIILAGEIAAPLARALAAEAAPGFSATQAQFTPDQRALVSAISERIIPTTDTPGAIAAGVPAFIEMMLADSYAPGDRDNVMNGLGLIEGYARVRYEKAFIALLPDEQDQVLTLVMQGRIPTLGVEFFANFRQLVALGYYTSEIGCKQERVYVPVPGRYDGKYPYADVRRVFSS